MALYNKKGRLAKVKEDLLESFTIRLNSFMRGREPLDDLVLRYRKVFDFDFEDKKKPSEKIPSGYKYSVPYVNTIIMTMVAFTIASLFGDKRRTLTADIEDWVKGLKGKDVENYCNSLLEKCKFKEKVFSMIVNAFVDPISWVQLIPIVEKNYFNLDIDTLNFFDVYWDTKAKYKDKTDYIVRSIKGHLDLLYDTVHYYPEEVEKIKDTKPPEDIITLEDQQYETQTGGEVVYYSPLVVNNNDKVEVMTWYTRYDLEGKGQKLDDVIVGIGNRLEIIRIELNPLKTRRKVLIYPIVANKNPNSLLGKSTVASVEDMQDLLNESIDLRQKHFRLLSKLLFKYNKNAEIDESELVADGGNAIGYSGDPKDLDTFEIRNMLKDMSAMVAEYIQLMQQTTGATDYLMGTSAGRGITETARGVTIIANNAMQKFNLTVTNMTPDLLDIITYIIILFNKNDKNRNRVNQYNVKKFAAMDELSIEESFNFDLVFKNQASDVDRERAQMISALNVVGQYLVASGGDLKTFMKVILEKFDLKTRDIKEIMGETEEAKKRAKEMQAGLMDLISKGGAPGGAGALLNQNAPGAAAGNGDQNTSAGGS